MTADVASAAPASPAARIKSTTDSFIKPKESELARWKRTFDKHATEDADGTK